MKQFHRYRRRVYFQPLGGTPVQMRTRSPFTFHLGSFYTWLMMAPWQMGG